MSTGIHEQEWYGTEGINSIKSQTCRRDIMKSGTKDQAEGKLHQARGKIKEFVGKVTMNSDLEGAGKDENLAGKVQEKMGQVKKLAGKQSDVLCAGSLF
jgi:uncharacterized protein YjbJ (UPF0337 family)